jgi:guanine deaminase
LNKNVFPAEARCADETYANQVAIDFARDALAQGVVGGAAYASIHMVATHLALSEAVSALARRPGPDGDELPGILRLDLQQAERDMRYIAESFGERTIVTDRFAVAVGSEMRRMASKLAERFGLRTQTHLNEQLREKAYVEKYLYPKAGSYTEVYLNDGLLEPRAGDGSPAGLGSAGAILAHCIHNTTTNSRSSRASALPSRIVRPATRSSAPASCRSTPSPTAASLRDLHGSSARSPTMSMLAEMAQYLKVHAGRSKRATPSEALYRATLAPAEILGLTEWLGTFEVGRRMSFIEIEPLRELRPIRRRRDPWRSARHERSRS